MLALDHFQKNFDLYSLVISDIRMPVMDVSQFIEKVKAIKHDVKVFFMSAFLADDIQFRTGVSSVKMDKYTEKPISVNDFIRIVKKYLLKYGSIR
jgi:CheY-like chemotaxis protein